MNQPTDSRPQNISVRYLKPNQAMIRYSMCRNSLTEIAKDAGAYIKIRRSVFIDTEVLDEYMSRHATDED